MNGDAWDTDAITGKDPDDARQPTGLSGMLRSSERQQQKQRREIEDGRQEEPASRRCGSLKRELRTIVKEGSVKAESSDAIEKPRAAHHDGEQARQ